MLARPPIRVLLVDDAVVVRRVISEAIERDPQMKVVAAARDGEEGLERLGLRPDVVVLDVEMPKLDGLGMLRELRRRHPELPVIMFSSVAARGAAITTQALAAGANDFVLKPSGQASSVESAVVELLTKIRLHHGANLRKRTEVTKPRPLRLRPRSGNRVELVVLGCSTGGPLVLSRLLKDLGAGYPLPILVVQHMPSATFTEALAASLASASGMTVLHAKSASRVRPGQVWIAAGGQHLAVTRGADGPVLRLTDDPPLNACRPAVDVLFNTAAKAYGPGVLGVLLTGMGKDGLAGAHAITQAQGDVIVQDEASSVVWGMPGAVAEAGLAAVVAPIPGLVAELAAVARASAVKSAGSAGRRRGTV